ncbi:MAG: hypothetical protein ACRC6M_17300 [Microcystaceae cyanobacterium]
MAELLMTPLGTIFSQPNCWEEVKEPTCEDCSQFKKAGHDGICQVAKKLVYPKRKGCLVKEIEAAKSPSKICGPCSECNSFDTSIPKDSIWQFCLLKGNYLSQKDLEGCENFKPTIPNQALSKPRRNKGDGSGYIRLHPIVENGKTYDQYYYHYEIWEGGDRVAKNCRYIPKKKLETIQSLDRMKAPVTKILYELGLII